jgi:ribosomal protein L15E
MGADIKENVLAYNVNMQDGRYKKFSVIMLDGKMFRIKAQRVICIRGSLVS